MKPILLLPLDERPVNVRYPQMLAESAGLAVRVPPPDLLSAHHRPGQTEALVAWLERAAPAASAVIVSLEMLGYGGLIASRTTHEPLAAVLGRLEVLRRLKVAFPAVSVIGYNVITRVSDADSAIEEPAYWARHGADLYRYSQALDRRTQGQPVSDEVAALEARIPAAVRSDFLWRRARNHGLNLAALQLLTEGVLDRLVLSSDDTGVYGLPSREKRWLAEWADRLDLDDRLLMYPGADEVGSVLVARTVLAARGLSPTLQVVYAPSTGAEHVAPYEDGPVRQTVDRQIVATGLTAVAADGQIWLGVAAPVATRGERDLSLLEPPEPARERALHELCVEAAVMRQGGRAVAIADVAYPNGADPALMTVLQQTLPLDRLAAYGAWNTAGNTLGTVLAQAALYGLAATPAQRAARERFLVHRFLEDWGYQTVVRRDTRHWLQTEHGLEEPTPATLQLTCDRIARGLADCLMQLGPLGTRWRLAPDSVRLPWGRLFEVDFELIPAS